MTEPVKKSKGFPFGEVIGLGALIISGLGLYNSWQNGKTGPTEVIERKVAVPFVLRGTVEDEGRSIRLAPADEAHSLDSLSLAFPGGTTVAVGSDGLLEAGEVADAMPDPEEKNGDGTVTATVSAQYFEAGSERTSKRRYAISYRWEGGGLLSGKKLRLTGFRRA
jgi:hypothetical protein